MIEISKSQKLLAKALGSVLAVLLCVFVFLPAITVNAGLPSFKDIWDSGTTAIRSVCSNVIGWAGQAVDQAVDAVTGDAEDEMVAAIGFEDIAKWSSAYLSTNLQPDKDGNVPGIKVFSSDGGGVPDAGDAGVFVAYVGKSWITSLNTISSTGASYSTYQDIPKTKNGGSTTDVIYEYCNYGYVLGQLGFDKSESGSVSIGTRVMGGITIVLYYLSLGVDILFYSVIQILKTLNPFTLFAKGINYIATKNGNGITMESYQSGTLSYTAFSGVQDFLKTWYTKIYDFSWAVLVPIFFVSLLVSLVLYRQTDKFKSKLKKYIIRIMFIVVGVPLLGGIYTAALDGMADAINPNTSPATKIICSTFVDFEAWASRGRLALTARNGDNIKDNDSLKISCTRNDSGLYTPTATEMLNSRNMAFLINNSYSMPVDMGSPIFSAYSGSGTVNNALSSGNMAGVDNATGNCAAVLNMLNRYSEGKYYTSAEFEGAAKGAMSSWINATDKGNKILNQFQTMADVTAWWVDDDSDDVVKSHRKRLTDMWHFGTGHNEIDGHLQETYDNGGTDWGVNLYANGGIKLSGTTYQENHSPTVPRWFDTTTQGGYSYHPPGSPDGYTIWITTGATVVKGSRIATIAPGMDGYSKEYGLSTCSMYNYLNTSFHDGMTLYSPSDTPTTWARENHRSVNVIGNGAVSFLYWLNCITMLLCYAVVGYFYGLGMLLANIGRMFQIVKAVPFAMLGSLKSIAELITYTIVMILEVVLTIFLYSFIAEIMFTIPDIITSPLAVALKDSYGNDSKTAYSIAMPVILIVLIIFYTWFMVKAIRMRKKFIKAMDEAAQEIVNKFIGVRGDALAQPTPGSANVNTNGGKGGLGAGLAVGGAAGLGGAALLGANNKKGVNGTDDATKKGVSSDDKKSKFGFGAGAVGTGAGLSSLLPFKGSDGESAGFDDEGVDDIRDRNVANNLDGNINGDYNEQYGDNALASGEATTKGIESGAFDVNGNPVGGYDKDGNPLNAQGIRVDGNGTPIKDVQGNYIDRQGNAADINGKPVKGLNAGSTVPAGTQNAGLPSGQDGQSANGQMGQTMPGVTGPKNVSVQGNTGVAPTMGRTGTNVSNANANVGVPYNPANPTQSATKGVKGQSSVTSKTSVPSSTSASQSHTVAVQNAQQNVQQNVNNIQNQNIQSTKNVKGMPSPKAPTQAQTQPQRQSYNPARQSYTPQAHQGGGQVAQRPQMPARTPSKAPTQNQSRPQARPQQTQAQRPMSNMPKAPQAPKPAQSTRNPQANGGVRNAPPTPPKDNGNT